MKTPKYLQDQIDALTQLKAGVHDHTALWAGLPVTEAQIDTAIAALKAQAIVLNKADDDLVKAKSASHVMVNLYESLQSQTEKLALGLHFKDPINLVDYGIDASKIKTPLGTPGKAIIAGLADDTDGEGYLLTIQSLSDSLGFDIERAEATSAEILTVDPTAFVLIDASIKLTYIDKKVKKGIRYFYRVRGTNRTTKGEWSAIVSRVQ